MVNVVGTWLLLAAPGTSDAQILEVTEEDANHRTHTIGDGDIVDINSRLTFNVSGAALRSRAASFSDSSGALARLARRYARLVSADSALFEALHAIEPGLAAWSSSVKDRPAQARLAETLAKVADPTLIVLDLLEGTPFEVRLNAALEERTRPGVAEQYALVYALLDQEVAGLGAQLGQLVEQEGVYVQAGAWLRRKDEDRPIHLEGFDRYPEREEYVVPRFRIALTPAVRQHFSTATGVAAALRSGTVPQLIGQQLKPALHALLATVERQLSAMDSQLVAIGGQLGSDTDELAAELGAIRVALQQDRAWIATKVDRYAQPASAGTSPAGLLETSLADMVDMADRLTALGTRLERLRAAARATTDRLPRLRTLLAPLIASGAASYDGAVRQLRDTGRSLQTWLGEVVGFSGQLDRTLEFGHEVLRVDIGSVPEQVSVRLPRTGFREPGDHFDVRIAMGSRSHERMDVARQSFELRRLMTHLDLVVGLTFARADTSGRDRSVYQPAPSYSILLKGWFFGINPRSAGYQRLWDPGIGLNLASLDFNHDDAQELGVGLVVSAVRDFLQVGYGYNVARGDPYVFFGLRLPVPQGTLPNTTLESGQQ